MQLFGHNRHGPKKLGRAAVPLWVGGAGSPSNTVSRGPRPTSVPSGILIHETIWPQYTRYRRQTDRRHLMTVAECCIAIASRPFSDSNSCNCLNSSASNLLYPYRFTSRECHEPSRKMLFVLGRYMLGGFLNTQYSPSDL